MRDVIFVLIVVAAFIGSLNARESKMTRLLLLVAVVGLVLLANGAH